MFIMCCGTSSLDVHNEFSWKTLIIKALDLRNITFKNFTLKANIVLVLNNNYALKNLSII